MSWRSICKVTKIELLPDGGRNDGSRMPKQLGRENMISTRRELVEECGFPHESRWEQQNGVKSCHEHLSHR
jgi:hypothetical protein